MGSSIHAFRAVVSISLTLSEKDKIFADLPTPVCCRSTKPRCWCGWCWVGLTQLSVTRCEVIHRTWPGSEGRLMNVAVFLFTWPWHVCFLSAELIYRFKRSHLSPGRLMSSLWRCDDVGHRKYKPERTFPWKNGKEKLPPIQRRWKLSLFRILDQKPNLNKASPKAWWARKTFNRWTPVLITNVGPVCPSSFRRENFLKTRRRRTS